MLIRGVEDIDALVRNLRDAPKELRRELYKELSRVTRDVKGPLIEAIPAALPNRGGLAAQIQAATRVRTTAKSGRYAGVSMRFTAKGHDIRTLTGKRLRHPVWGNRNVWVDQTAGVDPTVFLAKFEEQKPEVQAAILAACETVARKVTGNG